MVFTRNFRGGPPKATGKTVVFQNAWLFQAASGRLVSAQLYADTAAITPSAVSVDN